MLRLGVNVDHVATLRQARAPQGKYVSGPPYPDPVRAALVCQKAGASAIVMHLREDRRHVQDRDLFRAKDALRVKLNLEMSIAPEVVQVAARLVPGQATLVPERRQERTTEGGLDLSASPGRLGRALDVLRSKRVPVSLFIDPDPEQVDLAARLGVEAVEFHTGDYAHAAAAGRAGRELERLGRAVRLARQAGLVPHAGHGIDYANVAALKRFALDELNIGYSIVSRAVWVGLDRAVREMLGAMR